MNEQRIKYLLDLCEKATDPPWTFTEKLSGSENHKGFSLWYTNRHGDTIWLGDLSPQNNQDGDPSVEGKAVRDFVIAARTALPEALRELTEEKERAESNYQSCERVKRKFEDATRERDKALRELSLAMQVIDTDREFAEELEQKDAEIASLQSELRSKDVK